MQITNTIETEELVIFDLYRKVGNYINVALKEMFTIINIDVEEYNSREQDMCLWSR